MKKTVSIMIPCYNEEENVVPMSEAVVAQMNAMPDYDYEILFIDNCSTDNTRPLLRQICAKNPKIRAVLNVKNFGQFNSPYYGLCQTSGDCTISLCCDFQDPVEMIPKLVAEWEKGYQIVCAVKKTSQENKIMYSLRSMYYKTLKKLSSVELIEHFTGFGLYDRSFIDVLRNLDDPTPFYRGIVAELGGKHTVIEYEQAKRRAGKTHNNWATLYDAAMLSFTSYTKILLRLPVFIGGAVAGFSLLAEFVLLIMKLCNWNGFQGGTAAIVFLMMFMCAGILFFIGMLGEYVMAINARMMNRPLVVEEERLNFTSEKTKNISA